MPNNTIAQPALDADMRRTLIQSTTDIVTALIDSGENKDIKRMIREIFSELAGLSVQDAVTETTKPKRPAPAVPVDQSVKPDHIVCLEDGKKLKMLKRYLKTNYDMTPEDYRQRWNLPPNYPMVAPDYAKKRSQLARKIGLGKKRTAANSPAAAGRRAAAGGNGNRRTRGKAAKAS